MDAVVFPGIYCHRVPDSRKAAGTHWSSALITGKQEGFIQITPSPGTSFQATRYPADASFLGPWLTSGTQGLLLAPELSCLPGGGCIPHVQPPQSPPVEVPAARLVISAVTSPFAAACGGKSAALASKKGVNAVLIGKLWHFLPCSSAGSFPVEPWAHTMVCGSAVVYWDEIKGL